MVFPCALTLGTYAAIAKREDNLMRLVSGNIEPPIAVSLEKLEYRKEDGWGNNPKAITKLLTDMGHKLGGFDLYVWGNLPNNAGLSSSASVNVLVATALNTIFGLDMSPVEIALLCQRAENEYLGVNCGIMDMFASAMGKKDHAIMLDCSTLKYEYVPLKLGDYRLVLANTNNPRSLADSKYNQRRAECEEALKILRTVCDITNLCELSPDQFEEYSKKAFGEEVIRVALYGENAILDSGEKPKLTFDAPEVTAYRRALHVINENDRVTKAKEALEFGDISELGALMNASHCSLQVLYEVTGKELDALAYAAVSLNHPQTLDTEAPAYTKVHGSRMTGAGFGGCTVSIVHKDNVDDFIELVGWTYTKDTGLVADFYVAETDDGAREVYL